MPAETEPIWVVHPGITRAEIPWLCARFGAFLRDHDATVVTCDLAAVTDADLVVVEALVRLQLVAVRHGRRIRLRRVGRWLQDLLTLTGLGGSFRPDPGRRSGSGLPEPRRQPEQREQPRGVQEEVEPDDPAG